MVAIVSGNGLGLSLSSLALLGNKGVTGSAGGARNDETAYVNIANGNLVLQDRDDHLAALGLSVDIVRTYNSQGQFSDGGDNWNLAVNRKQLHVNGTLGMAGSTILRTDQDGTQAIYTYDATRDLYVNNDGAGANDTIKYDSSSEQLVWTKGSTGTTERYQTSGAGHLLSTTDISGNTVTYSYGSNGLLSQIVDADGETTYLDYSGNNLTQIRTVTQDGATATRVHYTYDSQNRLASVTIDLSPSDNSISDGKVYTTSYTYDGTSNRIASITQPDGSVQSFTYIQVGSAYEVATATDGNGQITTFSYDTTARRTTVTDPLGMVSTYGYDANGRLTQLTGPAVSGVAQSTSFTYGVGGHVAQITDAAGHAVTMQYDANGNQTQQQDSAGNTITRTFDSVSNQVLTETVYATPAAGATAASQPLTTRYVYNNQKQLRFVVSPEGRVTEYRYNGTGERISSIQYTDNIYSTTGLGMTDVPTADQMQAWVGMANLTQTQRTDIAYDFRGQVASVTSYASVDAAGNGIIDGTQSKTTYVYDQNGQLLSTLDGQSHSTQYTYDGLGRVLTTTDALGNVTVTQYDDANSKTIVRLSDGLTTTSTYDKDGRLVSVVQTNAAAQLLGTTSYVYDADGRLRMTQDPTGVRHYMLYDEAGRKVADIDGTGALTEYRYDADNNIISTTAYQNKPTAAALANLVDSNGNPASVTLASVRPAVTTTGPAIDRTNWNVYDAAGRLAMTISAAGDVAQRIYDGASRLLSEIQYATPIDTSALGTNPTVASATPPASAQDRIARNFYDDDGLLLGALDAEGYLTEYRYNAAGQQIDVIKYATPTSNALRASGTLDALLPAASSNDIHAYTLYNDKGQVSGKIDGEGYLTEYVYDAAGNIVTTVRYANKVSVPSSGLAGVTVGALRPASNAEDQVVSTTYTALNQLASRTNAEGTLTQYGYDTAGNLISTTTAAGTADVRAMMSQYDLQGRLTGELSAEGAALLTGGQTQAQVDAIWTQYGTHYTYDAAGRKTSATDANGNETLFYYDADGRLTQTINALGEVAENQYNSLGQLTAIIQYGTRIASTTLATLTGGLFTSTVTTMLAGLRNAALDSTTSITYTADGQVSTKKDALGNVSAFAYDAFGEVVSSTTAIDASHALTQTFSYDRRGLQTASATDPAGVNATTSTQYDAFGRVTRSVDANGNVYATEYDRTGHIVQTIDPTNALRSTTYDAFGRELTTTDADGNVTRYSYSNADRSMTVTSPEGVSVKTMRTRNGQTASVTDGLGNVTSYSYDKNGNLIQTSTPLTATSSQYDAANRLIKTTDASGNVVAYSYDAANRLLKRQVDPTGLNLTTSYQYDAKGQQVAVTDPNGVVTQIRYDAAGRKISQTLDPTGLNLTTSYSYDARGKVLTVTAPAGTVTSYVYDTLGRQTEQHVDPNGLNLVTSTAYDKNGNPVTVTDPNGHVTRYVYDADNRLVYTIDAQGDVSQNVYDAEGRFVQTTRYATPISLSSLSTAPTVTAVQAEVAANDAQDVTQYQRYDRDGRLTWIVDGMGGVVQNVYDANGNVIKRVSYANRLSASALAAVKASSSAIPTPAPDAARDEVVQTAYNALGRAIYIVDGNGGVVEQHYDGDGNLVERISYAKAISPSQPVNLANTAGQVAAIKDGAHDGHLRYVYDAAGRLTYSANGIGAVTQNIYDKNGNLTRTIAYATLVATPLTSTTVLSSVISSSDDRVNTYAYDNAGRQIYAINALGAVTKQVFDSNGNVVQRIAYAKALAATGISAPTTTAAIQSAIVADSGNDRVTRAAFDGANRQVFAVDALGYVTQYQYDAAGNLVASLAYSKAIDTSGLPSIATVASVTGTLEADNGNDRLQSNAYDAANRLVYTVDPLGYVKQTQYDGIGRIVRTVQYATPVADSVNRISVTSVAAAVQANASTDQSNTFAYDGAGNLVSSADALGYTESYTYNGVGDKLTFTNKKGATWTYDYDAAGRMIKETDPAAAVATVVAAANGTLSIDEAASGSVSLITTLQYDVLGNLLSRTEAAGRPEQRVTSYQYDALGRQIRTIYPAVSVYNAAADNLTTNGATSLTTRTETENVTLTSDVLYDVFGDAVASRDVAGNVSYKTYDKTGNVSYDVDAMGYVTGYTRDAFGNVTRLSRFAAATTLTSNGYMAISAASIAAAINASGVDHSGDRAVVTVYDRRGQAVQVTQPNVYAYDSSAVALKQYAFASEITTTTYNAFGQATSISALQNSNTNTWTTTYQYYDQRGMQTATVDALGYLTTFSFDAEGNQTTKKEFANKIAAGGWNTFSYTAPAAGETDRTTQYAYDQLNRKISETQVNVAYTNSTGGSSTTGNLVTSYGYDAVGNQTWTTDATGASTYTYYDALGRIAAVAAPNRTDTVGGASLVPLTAFRRDAYGNVVAQIAYARGASSATATSYAVAGADAQDRTSYTMYDSHGNAIQSTDATGVTHYASFDANGRVVKQWQAVAGNDGITHTLFEAFQYDKVGNRTDVIDPASTATLQGSSIVDLSQAQAGVTDTHAAYNAFGEVVATSVNGTQVEYAEYDNAGRVWRTNAGDGIDKVTLYDLQGHATARIQSAGTGLDDINIRNLGTIDQIAALADTRRIDTIYDANGQAIQEIEPQRTDVDGGVIVRQAVTHTEIASSESEAFDESGNFIGWGGTNSVTLAWTTLAGLGNGDIKVQLSYVTQNLVEGSNPLSVDESGNPIYVDESGNPISGPVVIQAAGAATQTQIFSGPQAAAAATGVTMNWNSPSGTSLGGISQVTRISVYKKDVQGNWQLVIDQTSQGVEHSVIEIAAPNDPKTVIQVQIAPSGASSWSNVSVVNFGDALRADLSALPYGSYQYRVLTTVAGSTTTSTTASGTITVAAPALTAISNTISYGAAGAGILAWQTPGTSVDEVFRYRPSGTSTWIALPASSLGNGYDGVDTNALAGGDYDYELLWMHKGDSAPYAHATGKITVTNAVPSQYVPPVNLPNITTVNITRSSVGGTSTYDESGNVTGVTGGTIATIMQWPTPPQWTTEVFYYRPVGATSWTSAAIFSYDGGYDESGNPVGTQNADLSSLGAGNYEFQLLFTSNHSESSGLNAQATGNFTIYLQDAGHYETQYVQVQVPVTVMPPDPANYIVGWSPAQYGSPVVVGTDESGNQILGAHYAWQGSVAVAVPYQVTQVVGYTTETRTQQVPTQGPPVIWGYDESGNPIYTYDESGNILYTTVYVTQSYTVTVPVYGNVTVTPPDPANYMIVGPTPIYTSPVVIGYGESGAPVYDESGNPELGAHYQWQGNYVVGVPYTVMETQTQEQQVWIPGAIPAPTMVFTTPPYTPGYTTAAIPKGYSASSTTGSNATGLTVGAVDTQSASGSNTQNRSYRPVVNRTYDRWGNVLSVSDPRSPNWITTYKYNVRNQVIEQDQPNGDGVAGAGPVTKIGYDRLGRQVVVMDADGNVNKQIYDADGNLAVEYHADGGVVRHVYNAFGDQVQVFDALGNATSYAYDKLDRLTKTTYTVKDSNDPQSANIQTIVETIDYDAAGRKRMTINGNGETTSYTYDLRGNITATTQYLGQVTRDAYDAQGHKIAEVDANGSVATWRYDYFGHLQAHTDIGGAVYSYSYDNAWQLIAQTNTRGQSLAYVYDAAGQQTRITDNALGQVTTYAYNGAGQHVLERTVQGGVIYQNTHLAYDALGRLRAVDDGRVALTYDYDNAGNRIHEHTHVINVQDATKDSDLYYGYDAMNRQVVVDAYDAQGDIKQGQGHLIGYDLNGNRTSDTSIGTRITAGGGNSIVAGYTIDDTGQLLVDESGNPILNVSFDSQGKAYYGTDESGHPLEYLTAEIGTAPTTYSASIGRTTEQYKYDSLGRIEQVYRDGTLVDTRHYDGASRLVQSGPAGALSKGYTDLLGGNPDVIGVQSTINHYDGNGRLQSQQVLNADGTAKYSISYDSYDAVGNVLQYRLTNQGDSSYTNTYVTTLAKYEGYVESSVSATSTLLQPGSTSDSYDVNGNLIGVSDSSQSANNRTLVNDAQGHVLYRNQAGNQEYFVFANGQQVGTTGMGIDVQAAPGSNGAPSFTDIEDFNIGYRSISANYPSASVGSYRVSAGDSLQSIAQSAYGDSSLWYMLADANGLRGNADLKVGQTITIPNKVTDIHNNGTTFKPYDPSKAVGDTTPYLAQPHHDGGCGGLGTILMVVVAVVATIYTAGLASGASGGFMATMSAGSTALTGGGAAMSLEAAATYSAIGGAVGSVAGQVVGNALGVEDGFSWSQVAASALTAGVSAGVAGEAASMLGSVQKATTTASMVAKAAISNAVTQGIGVVTGLQDSFDWKGVAAAAAGAGVGSAVSHGLAGGGFAVAFGSAGNLAVRTLSGLAAGTTTGLLDGGRISATQVATDAFGNALGESIAANDWSSGQQTGTLAQARQQVSASGSKVDMGVAQGVKVRSDIWGGSTSYPDYQTADLSLTANGVPSLPLQMGNAVTQAGDNSPNTSSIGVVDVRSLELPTITNQIDQIIGEEGASSAFVPTASINEANTTSSFLWDSVAANGSMAWGMVGRGQANSASRSVSLDGQGARASGDAPTLAGTSDASSNEGLWSRLTGSVKSYLNSQEFVNDMDLFNTMVTINEGLAPLQGAAPGAAAIERQAVRDAEMAAPESFSNTASAGVGANSGNAVDLARNWQSRFPYLGQDPMRPIALSEGKVLAQVVFEGDASPAGSYFTTASAIRRATLADGSIDANILNQGLQIDASKYTNFRSNVQYFSVNQEIPYGEAAFGRTIANPHLNPDGYSALPQVFIKEEHLGNLTAVDRFGNPGVTAYPMVNTKTPPYPFMWIPRKP